jgi:toxin ParE1/3/4
MKVVYFKSASRDLDNIRNYIAQDNSEVAERVVARIKSVIGLLENHPFMGRPGKRGTRLLTLSGLPYLVIYRVRNDEVRVVAVFHSARNRSLS